MKAIYFKLVLLCSFITQAQTEIVGTVIDANYQPVPGTTVTVEETDITVTSDFNGVFKFSTTKQFPITITVSGNGFEPTTTPERVFESPVSVENYSLQEIKSTTAADFYAGLENFKGVDINTNSVVLKSINARGFSSFANFRFVQLVDGMDTTSPALNFVVGNIAGLTELDVQGIELLPGASSALYGANAFNGILLMSSKSPFDYPGISAYYRGGITSQDSAGDNFFYDYGIRGAKDFSKKFAAKVNFSYTRGEDWLAVNEEDQAIPGASRSNPSYNGLNVYGDEVGESLLQIGQRLSLPPNLLAALPNTVVTRTGYQERDLLENEFLSLKFDGALHYRPFANDLEVIYGTRVTKGNTTIQNGNRTALRNFNFLQNKIEIKNKNFFLRGYITADNAGDTYDLLFTGINLNKAWKDDKVWFEEYITNFLGTVGTFGEQEAHRMAREIADTGRLKPGTPEFNEALDQVIQNPDFSQGSKFKEESEFRHVNGNYNLGHITGDIAEIQVGGSFREYKLNSFGTLFTDDDGPIKYSEYGMYVQAQRKILEEKLKVTASIRYDKSQLFDGAFTPRFSLGYTFGSEKNQNLRASIQTGFRNPSAQDLYIGLDLGQAFFTGSAQDNLDRVVKTVPLSVGGTVPVTPRLAYENSFSLQSVLQQNPVKANIDIVEPEKVTALELGYRAKLGRIILDVNGYYNLYKNFIAIKNVVSPLYGRIDDIATGDLTALGALQNMDFVVFAASSNSSVDISSFGVVAGITGKAFGNYDFGFNYTYAKQDFDKTLEPDFESNFNTPTHRVKASFGNENVIKNLGFNTNVRWNDEYLWESNFADGQVPSFTVIDAQVSYRIPLIKSVLKVGANNLTGKDYFTAFGSGSLGSQYYIGLSVNNF